MNGTVMTTLAVGLGIALVVWTSVRRSREVRCAIDLVSTEDHFGAHVQLDGIEVNEGDSVLVHDAPDHIPLGTIRTMSSRATVQQASLPRRFLTRILGTSEITGLYEVGFEG